MNIEELRKPLPIDRIDFRVQHINEGGYATILAYKDARVDMDRLDDVCGAKNWRREHKRENHNCIVSIWDAEKSQWVGKEDTGTESYSEAEKGLASDSFKRACFNWGIGRELYEYPFIQVKLHDDEFRIKEYNGKKKVEATWKLNLKKWRWQCHREDSELVYLAAFDEKGGLRYQYGSVDKAVKYNDLVRCEIDAIHQLKTAIANDEKDLAVGVWFDLDQGVREKLLGLAPTKGGIFTTEERTYLRQSDFGGKAP